MRSLVRYWPNGVALFIWTACFLGIGIHVIKWPENPVKREEFVPILGPDTTWWTGLPDSEKAVPDYRGRMLANMEKVEADLPSHLAHWKYYVPPGLENAPPPPPPEEEPRLTAALSPPSLTLVRTGSRVAELRASFGDADRYCAERVLLVWRRSGMRSGWRDEPLVKIRQRADGKVEAQPSDAVEVTEEGFRITDRGLAVRRSFVYRARTVARFRKEAREGPGALYKLREVIPPPPGSGTERAAGHDKLLAGGKAYAGAASADVQAKIPGDVQVRFSGMEPGTKKAYLSLRRFVAGKRDPIVPDRKWGDSRKRFSTQFVPGDFVRAGWVGNIAGKQVCVPVDAQLALLDVTTRERKEIRQRLVTRVNDKGFVLTEKEDYIVTITETVAVLRDQVTGGDVTLVKGGKWWPNKVAGPQAAGAGAGAGAAAPEVPKLGAVPEPKSRR
jgi:hypothetical protein